MMMQLSLRGSDIYILKSEKKTVSPREKRGVSPLLSQLIRSGSLINSTTTPNSTNAITRVSIKASRFYFSMRNF